MKELRSRFSGWLANNLVVSCKLAPLTALKFRYWNSPMWFFYSWMDLAWHCWFRNLDCIIHDSSSPSGRSVFRVPSSMVQRHHEQVNEIFFWNWNVSGISIEKLTYRDVCDFQDFQLMFGFIDIKQKIKEYYNTSFSRLSLPIPCPRH